tara:strand:- start:675 stop:884 length:210 start_codon:yes stop_codon:yes gene_type:complete
MRYRGTICVDVWADTKEEAEMLMDIHVLGLPNAFQIALSRMPHGSEISLVQENLPNSSLISKADKRGGR